MTLLTSINGIDELYPVAGQDNNTQGFRDNFNYIKTALQFVNEDLDTIKTNSVKVATFDENNDPVENDLQGSSLINGSYSDFHGLTHIELEIPGTSQSLVSIDIKNGPFQLFTATSPIPSFTFVHWPGTSADNLYGNIRVHFAVDGTEVLEADTADNLLVGKTYTIVATGTTNWNEVAGTTGITYQVGDVVIVNPAEDAENPLSGSGTAHQWRELNFYDTNVWWEKGISGPLLLDPLGSHTVIEAWSYDGGVNVFVKILGIYASSN